MNPKYLIILEEAQKKAKKAWPVFLVVALLFASGGYYYASLSPTIYSAKSVFYPDKDATISGSPLEIIASGGSLPASKAGVLGVFAKILSSRSMTKQIVSRHLDSTIDSRTLADIILEDHNSIYKPWQEKEDLKKMSKSAKVERAAAILRNGCFTVIDESGFMSLINQAHGRDAALMVNKAIIQELIKFNYDKKTEKAANDLIYINHRLDSVESLYEAIKYQNANYIDANKYLIKATVKIPMDDLDERKKIISQRYLKLVDAQEQALVRYQTDKPVVQLLDLPYIESTKSPTPQTTAFLCGILSLFLTLLFVLRNIIISSISAFVKNTFSRLKNPSKEEDNMNTTAGE
jgi:uncharacterized protein involved in exopolysaccharide biosynthesis